MPRFLAIVGRDPSENIAVTYYLIRELRRRKRSVSILMENPSAQQILDQSKVLWERDLNSEIAMITSTNETLILISKRIKLSEVMPLLSGIDYVILLEGSWDLNNLVKIVVARSIDEAINLYDDLTIAISGSLEGFREKTVNLGAPIIDYRVESDKLADIVEQKALHFLPGFLHCGECGYKTCREFIKATVTGQTTLKMCPILAREDVTLEVDGEKIPLKSFPREIVKNVILGIVSSLKNKKEASEIKITIKRY